MASSIMNKFLSETKQRQLKNQILQILIDRVPNPIRFELILRQLPNNSMEEINQTLDSLVSEQKIKFLSHENKRIPGRTIKAYELTNPSDYPYKETFMLGDQELPRFIAGDPLGAEDTMEKFEALQIYINSLEQKYSKLTNEMTKKYWLNVTTLFGLFISVFSLIIKGSEPILIDASKPIDPMLLIQLKSAQLLPLALILFIFVLFLRFAIKMF